MYTRCKYAKGRRHVRVALAVSSSGGVGGGNNCVMVELGVVLAHELQLA